MPRDIGIRVVHERSVQRQDPTGYLRALVRIHAAPARRPAPHETEYAAGIPVAMVPPTSEVADEAWHHEAAHIGRCASHRRTDLGCQLRGHTLVGVDVQHPL